MVTERRASEYNRYRLAYSKDAANFVLQKIGIPNVKIADIGAGTGLVSRCFTGKAKEIFAIDPDKAMRRVAQSALASSPEVSVIDGTAESTGLPDESVDLITVGNALHRFRAVESRNEFSRILKKDGWLALFSYSFNDFSLGGAMNDVRKRFPQIDIRKETGINDKPVEYFFGQTDPRKYMFPQVYEENWEAFWGAAKSCMEAPVHTDDWYTDYKSAYRELFGRFARNGILTVYYSTEVVLGQPKRQPKEYSI